MLQRLAQRLRGRGYTVHRPRIGKRHHSRPARAIRDLTRDLANLELCPRAELSLYCAREAQVLSESVIPALARGEIVLLDRGLLTPVVLGSWGRGLPLADCEAMARAARGEGPVPTLTVVFDVELRTARQRKQIAKVRAHGLRDGGRKGVAGSGFKARIRAGYRALAADDPSLRLIVSERDEPELEASPIAVAHALAGVTGDAADQLRQRLLARIPSRADPEQRRGHQVDCERLEPLGGHAYSAHQLPTRPRSPSDERTRSGRRAAGSKSPVGGLS